MKKIFFLIILLFLVVVFSNYIVVRQTNGKTYDDVTKVPYHKVGLVLGTGKYLKNGQLNSYFVQRINAVAKLYKHHKIDYILVSGDNSRSDYDEPNDFKSALISKGIPEEKIILDYAGFRTLDSVIRAKKVFGQTEITIISQKFHNQRAIFIAENNAMIAVGFNAEDLRGASGLKTHIREYLARLKAVLDIIFWVQPKFLGPKVSIG